MSCQVWAMSPWAKATFQMNVWRMESPGIARFLSPSRTPGPVFRTAYDSFVFFPPSCPCLDTIRCSACFTVECFRCGRARLSEELTGYRAEPWSGRPTQLAGFFPGPRTPNIEFWRPSSEPKFPTISTGLGIPAWLTLRSADKRPAETWFSKWISLVHFEKRNLCRDSSELHCRLPWKCRNTVCFDGRAVSKLGQAVMNLSISLRIAILSCLGAAQWRFKSQLIWAKTKGY